MKVKLSEIFVRKPECHIYTIDELSILRLKNAFIQRLADRFDLSYVEDTDNSNDLCYAENREIRPEYRNTFSRREVLDIVLLQVCNPVVDLEADEVEFPTDARSFFSESFKSLVDIEPGRSTSAGPCLNGEISCHEKSALNFQMKFVGNYGA